MELKVNGIKPDIRFPRKTATSLVDNIFVVSKGDLTMYIEFNVKSGETVEQAQKIIDYYFFNGDEK